MKRQSPETESGKSTTTFVYDGNDVILTQELSAAGTKVIALLDWWRPLYHHWAIVHCFISIDSVCIEECSDMVYQMLLHGIFL